MNSKLLASTLLAASLLGAPAVVFAQTSPPPDTTGPSGAGEAQTAPKAMHHHAMHRHMAHRVHFEAGTTTGMSSSTRARPGGQSVARKPAAN